MSEESEETCWMPRFYESIDVAPVPPKDHGEYPRCGKCGEEMIHVNGNVCGCVFCQTFAMYDIFSGWMSMPRHEVRINLQFLMNDQTGRGQHGDNLGTRGRLPDDSA